MVWKLKGCNSVPAQRDYLRRQAKHTGADMQTIADVTPSPPSFGIRGRGRAEASECCKIAVRRRAVRSRPEHDPVEHIVHWHRRCQRKRDLEGEEGGGGLGVGVGGLDRVGGRGELLPTTFFVLMRPCPHPPNREICHGSAQESPTPPCPHLRDPESKRLFWRARELRLAMTSNGNAPGACPQIVPMLRRRLGLGGGT